MQNPSLLYPVIALALWTLCILLIVPIARFRAAFRGEVGAGDFRFGESAQVPGRVALPNRNYMNLLESPVLFYAVCLLMYASGGVSPGLIAAAWIFVALRIAHSLIHLSYNSVMHRLAAFAASIVVLIFMWLLAALHVAAIHDVWRG